MAAAHPYGAFVGCGIKRIGCARRIKVNDHSMSYAVHSAYTQGKLLQINLYDFIEAGLADILMLFFIIQRLDSA